MGGRPWQDLMKAFSETLNKINKFAKNGNVYISVINFESNYRIIYERQEASKIDIGKIVYKSGGTYFEPVFNAAYSIASKTINKEMIIFIFMTDGYAEYPTNGINNFTQMMNQYPKKFVYQGI